MMRVAVALATLSLTVNSISISAWAQDIAPDSSISPTSKIDQQSTLDAIKKTLGDVQPKIKEVRPDVIQEL